MVDCSQTIKKFTIGIYSSEDVIKDAVCCVNTHSLTGPGSVYDERMGPVDSSFKNNCVTCGLSNRECPGHLGYIKLNAPFIHPLMNKEIIGFIRCLCVFCYQIRLHPDRMKTDDEFMDLHGLQRFVTIKEMMKKEKKCPWCHRIQPKVANFNHLITSISPEDGRRDIMSADHIKLIFDNVSDETVRMMGLDPELIHPKNLIITNLVVIPPVARPPVKSGNKTCDDDITMMYKDIVKLNDKLLTTKKNTKILTALGMKIKSLMDNHDGKDKRNNRRPRMGIKERLSGKEGLVRKNTQGKRVNQSGRAVAGPDPTLRVDEIAIPPSFSTNLFIPEYVSEFNRQHLQKLVNSGKTRHITKLSTGTNCLTKRVLVNRGTSIHPGDVIVRRGVYLEIDQNRCILVDVHHDIVHLSRQRRWKNERSNSDIIVPLHMNGGDSLVRNGVTFNIGNYLGLPIVEDGDEVIRGGVYLPDVRGPHRSSYELQIGDIVSRNIRDGDIILMNRQPTLHKGSMIALKAKIREGSTMRINLAITKSLNADFDGDEFNCHIPQSYQTMTEISKLASVSGNFITPQSGKANITIVQDALLASYKMTSDWTPIERGDFFNHCMHIDKKDDMNWSILDRIREIRMVLDEYNIHEGAEWSGRGLFSMILPRDLCYKTKTLTIDRGVVCDGIVNKSVLGGSHNSLNQMIFKEYGARVAMEFTNNVQFIGYQWLSQQEFSVGLDDCVTDKQDEIDDVVLENLIKAEHINSLTEDPIIREMRVNESLGKAKDMGMKIAKDSLSPSNAFSSMITAGSKGDFFNMAQIMGLLGQQNVFGRRVERTQNSGRRTLPHYPFDESEFLTVEEKYKSRGFILSSFSSGLDPQEFFFHASAAREGLTDTSTKTADSGYVQRKMTTLMADVKVAYDGTVRNGDQIVQFVYGADGFAGDKTIVDKFSNEPTFCDVQKIVDRLHVQ